MGVATRKNYDMLDGGIEVPIEIQAGIKQLNPIKTEVVTHAGIGHNEPDKPIIFPADKAFRLHDTYGFPIDLIKLLCDEKGIGLDIAGYEGLMDKQRARSRADRKKKG